MKWKIEHEPTDGVRSEFWIICNDEESKYFSSYDKGDANWLCEILNELSKPNRSIKMLKSNPPGFRPDFDMDDTVRQTQEQ